MSAKTSEAYTWSREAGLKHGGFVCKGVVTPPLDVKAPVDTVYDVIVIGAGYAGLAAARDLSNAGRSVLMIEGRDRVGGRTYTIEEDDFKYEMGGAWVYHTQPYTFREMMRYKMEVDLISSADRTQANNYFSFNVPGFNRHVSHEESAKLLGKTWKLFIDVDGEEAKKICPLPHSQIENPWVSRKDVEKWDAYSCWDRYLEIKDQLTEEECGLLIALLLSITGGKPDLRNSGFWDMIRSHAINGHSFEHMDEIWVTYKLREGQSTLARHMFDEAVDFGLEYTFNTHVERIEQFSPGSGFVKVHTRDGRVFNARKAVCTAPLNTLKSITFSPPLSELRQEVANAGHINFMTKAHAVVKGPGMASWNGACHPNPLSFAYGDGILPSGDAHLVSFGADYRDEFVLEEHPERLVQAFENFHPMEVKKIAFHNWNTDPYTQGGPCFMPPKFMTTYMEELRKRHGNIFFANADWARAWRNFIDGALEQGSLNGFEILNELHKEDKERVPPTPSL